MAPTECYLFGSGVRTPNNIENGHKYKSLNVCSVRGPKSKEFLETKKGIRVPSIFGDPALILPIYYSPVIDNTMKQKIAIIPHKSNYHYYISDSSLDKKKYILLNPLDHFSKIVDTICSCKAVISSSLHGLICSDAFNIPNVWLDEHKLEEGDYKFRDYFESQGRKYFKINSIQSFKESSLYVGGNKIDINSLLLSFPFR